jgi:hypothetical protein
MTARFVPVVMAAMLLTSGCLLKDTKETWYLGQKGAVKWVVTESDVRSDAQAPTDRQNEETTYRLAFERQDHPMVRGFRELGLVDIRTIVLRNEAPFTVRTEAQGLTIGELGMHIIARAGLWGVSTLEHDGDTWTWKFTARDLHAPDAAAKPDDDLGAVLNDLDSLSVVLVDGRFLSATGFKLSGDGRVATIAADNHGAAGDDESMMVLELKWIAGAVGGLPISLPAHRR